MIGTDHALHELRPDGVVLRYSSLQGLPVGHATSLSGASGPNASLWIGTDDGLVEMSTNASAAPGDATSPSWRYYSGDRWLPTNTTSSRSVVTDVSTSPPTVVGTPGIDMVWVATDVGVAVISMVAMTLEDKAMHYQSMVSPRHDRYDATPPCACEHDVTMRTFHAANPCDSYGVNS